MVNSPKSKLDEKLAFIFKLYDIDGNGRVTIKEIEKIIESIYDLQGIDANKPQTTPLTVAHQIMQRFDIDGDKTINKDEFILGFKCNQYVANLLLDAFKEFK